MDVDYVQQLEQQNEQLVKKLGWVEKRYSDALELRAGRRYQINFDDSKHLNSLPYIVDTAIFAPTVDIVKHALKQEVIDVLTSANINIEYFDMIVIDCVYYYETTFNVWTLEMYKKDKWYYSAFRSAVSRSIANIDGVPVDWLNAALTKIGPPDVK